MKQSRWVLAAGIASGMFAVSGGASAQSSFCSSILSSYSSLSCTTTPGCQDNYRTNHPECFGSTSSTAAASQTIGVTTLQQMLTISNAAGLRFSGFQTPPGVVADTGQRSGLAAGGAADKWNVWGSVSDDNSKYDGGNTAVTANRIKSDLDVTNLVFGTDYLLSPTLALGASVA